MKRNIGLNIIFTFIIFNWVFINNIQSQNYEQTKLLAEKLFQNKNYESALKLYKRLIFFREKSDSYDFFFRSGELSLLVNDNAAADYYFNLAYNNTNDIEKKNKCLFNKAYAEMSLGNFRYAQMDLFSIENANNDKSIELKKNFYLATCYFGLEDFKKAEQHFLKCVDANKQKEIKKLLNSKKLYRPVPKTAKILSLIIPGLGQMYSGHIKDGVISFALLSSLYYFTVINAINVSKFGAVLTFGPWIQRYYTGGYQKSEMFAIEKRLQNRNEIYNKVLKIIKNNTIKDKTVYEN